MAAATTYHSASIPLAAGHSEVSVGTVMRPSAEGAVGLVPSVCNHLAHSQGGRPVHKVWDGLTGVVSKSPGRDAVGIPCPALSWYHMG